MEASEKQQLPLGGSAVRALDDRLVIENLTVTDERAARVVRERAEAGHDSAETVKKSIEIGTRLMDSEATAANVDYVRRELEAGLGDLDRRLEGRLEEGTEALAERIAATFGAERNDSVQVQIKEIVSAETRAQRDALISTLTAEDGSNPLLAVQTRLGKRMLEAEERHRSEVERLRESHSKEARSMQAQVAELRKELARLLEREESEVRVAEAEEAGTRKGRDFEARVHEAIERIASARGDCAHHTGDQPAEGGGKKGDTVVEIAAADGPAQGRIVFEAKDKQGISKQSAWRELNGSLDRRAADFAVLVVAGADQIPSGREPLHEYEGNKMIAAVHRDEPDGIELEAAYRLAVARVRMAKTRSLTVDAEGVRNSVESAIAALKEAQKIRSALTGAGKTIASVRESLDGMVEAVEQQLQRIESLVAAADDSG
jgi:hypothetical protein